MRVPARATPASVELLVEQVVGGLTAEAVESDLRAWIGQSRRFRAWVEAHRDKIHKKLRGAARDPEAGLDVRAELSVARHLLADRRIELDFEAYGSGKGGPDFTLSFRGARSLNLEITRLRQPPSASVLVGTLLTKLRQLPPGIPNVVLVCAPGERCDGAELEEAVRSLRARAEAKVEAYFAARGLTDARGFYQRFLRLTAVVTWCEAGEGDARAAVWVNRSARIASPEAALRACVVALQRD